MVNLMRAARDLPLISGAYEAALLADADEVRWMLFEEARRQFFSGGGHLHYFDPNDITFRRKVFRPLEDGIRSGKWSANERVCMPVNAGGGRGETRQYARLFMSKRESVRRRQTARTLGCPSYPRGSVAS